MHELFLPLAVGSLTTNLIDLRETLCPQEFVTFSPTNKNQIKSIMTTLYNKNKFFLPSILFLRLFIPCSPWFYTLILPAAVLTLYILLSPAPPFKSEIKKTMHKIIVLMGIILHFVFAIIEPSPIKVASAFIITTASLVTTYRDYTITNKIKQLSINEQKNITGAFYHPFTPPEQPLTPVEYKYIKMFFLTEIGIAFAMTVFYRLIFCIGMITWMLILAIHLAHANLVGSYFARPSSILSQPNRSSTVYIHRPLPA